MTPRLDGGRSPEWPAAAHAGGKTDNHAHRPRPRRAAEKREELAAIALEGTWEFASLVVDGQTMSGEALRTSRLLIDGDRFRTETPEGQYEGVFNINVEANPHEIDIVTVAPERAVALIERSQIQAYVGADPHPATLPASVGVVESLGSFIVVTVNPDTRRDPCAVTAAVIDDFRRDCGL